MKDYPEFVITLSHNKNSEKHVTLAFTLGLKALEKGYKTAILLMLDGVYAAKKGYGDDIDFGEPFLPVKDMLEVYFDQGGQLLVCGSCWKHEHLAEAERMEKTAMVTADDVIDIMMKAKSHLDLN